MTAVGAQELLLGGADASLAAYDSDILGIFGILDRKAHGRTETGNIANGVDQVLAGDRPRIGPLPDQQIVVHTLDTHAVLNLFDAFKQEVAPAVARCPFAAGADRAVLRKLPVAPNPSQWDIYCLLYTSDAADERSSVDLGG